MDTVCANSLAEEIDLVVSIDNKIGFELQLKSRPALLQFTEALLYKLEKEVSIRDAALLSRDAELSRNIEIINDIYKSYRYRIGRFLVRPFEVVLLKLGMIKDPQNFLNASSSNAKMD